MGWELKLFLWVPSPSIFANYSVLMSHGSGAKTVHVWWIAITEFLVFALDYFVAASRDGLH